MKGDHYPVRRKGEQRRLDPDWVAIAHLEAMTERLLKVIDGTGGDAVTRGWIEARNRGNYVRPMLQLIPLPQGQSRVTTRVPAPCPSCDNWARTTRCAEHPEVTLAQAMGREPMPGDAAGFAMPLGIAALDAAGREMLGVGRITFNYQEQESGSSIGVSYRVGEERDPFAPSPRLNYPPF